MLPHSEHVVRRRAYATHYTPSNLALFQPEINQYALQLVDVCHLDDPRGTLFTC